jgi:hypothetical protein
MGATAKVKVKKGGPNWKLRYGRKPTLSFSDGTSNTHIEERDAFTNHIHTPLTTRYVSNRAENRFYLESAYTVNKSTVNEKINRTKSMQQSIS